MTSNRSCSASKTRIRFGFTALKRDRCKVLGPNQQTFSEAVGMSQRCHERKVATHRGSIDRVIRKQHFEFLPIGNGGAK
jgi:hypothetical protein